MHAKHKREGKKCFLIIRILEAVMSGGKCAWGTRVSYQITFNSEFFCRVESISAIALLLIAKMKNELALWFKYAEKF